MPTPPATGKTSGGRGREHALGVFWSFLSAFLWSTTFVSARFLLGSGKIDPFLLSASRFLLGGALVFGLACFVLGKRMFRFPSGDYVRLALLSLAGIVGMSVLLFLGQRDTSAINSSLIMQTCPVTMLFLGVLIGERLSSLKILGVVVSMAGCLLIVEVLTASGLRFDSDHIRGDILVFAGASCWAVYSVFSKGLVVRHGGLAVTAWSMVFGAAELLILLLFIPRESLCFPSDRITWLVALYIGVFPTAVAFFAWFEAMGKIDFSLLSVMQYLTPVFTVLLAWALLGESVGATKALGIVLVLAGVALTGAEKRRGSGSS